MPKHKGLFVVVDGLDGIGKGEIERAIIDYEQKLGLAVFDSISFSRAHSKGLPELKDFWNPPETHYDLIMNAEPTYAGIGHTIREEITKKGNNYDYHSQIQAYSLDRLVSMTRIVIPALQKDLTVFQSRCLAATLCYQLLKAEQESYDRDIIIKQILNEEGNKLQLEWAPDLLIIPTIKDINELMNRLEKRKEYKKDDNSIFDNLNFQSKLAKYFEDPWLKKLFESHSTKVEYIDAGISEQSTREQALEIYKKFLGEWGM